jgi:hypothetical protein
MLKKESHNNLQKIYHASPIKYTINDEKYTFERDKVRF